MNAGEIRLGWKATLSICFFILASAVGFIVLIFSTEPTASRTGAVRQTAMLVETVEVLHGEFHPTIIATGTVIPAREVILSPRVDGTVVDRSQAFTPGGYVEKGKMLLRIDPADYENILEQRKSEMRRAVSDLEVEMGRQKVARMDYQLLGRSLSAENEALVLRKPQLDAARARVQSARTAVKQAELELRRTMIKAPFDAHILSRNVDVGSQVSAGDDLGRLVGLENYWIEAAVPQSKLRWLSFPDAVGEAGSEVRIRNRSAWAEDEYRTGRLYKLIGALEGRTRMARVLVTVPDPLLYKSPSSSLPRLMIGAFVEVNIMAEKIAGVARLARDYIRKNDTVWVMKEGRLEVRDVDIVFRDADYAYIRSGLHKDELVVATNLTTAAEGARLRRKEPDPDSENESGNRKKISPKQESSPAGDAMK